MPSGMRPNLRQDFYSCPFCGMSFDDRTGSIAPIYHLNYNGLTSEISSDYQSASTISVKIGKCPKCKKCSFEISPVREREFFVLRYPPKEFPALPDYVPAQIQEDLREAILIADLSPKASATLSRRCLQGMIRDFWGIKKKTLNDEINELQDKINVRQWEAIDSLRKIGNVGAHMEKDINCIVDVEPDEAMQLIKLLELLVQKWYIDRHDEEQLCSEIKAAAAGKANHK